jgi:hypothetical protein
MQCSAYVYFVCTVHKVENVGRRLSEMNVRASDGAVYGPGSDSDEATDTRETSWYLLSLQFR